MPADVPDSMIRVPETGPKVSVYALTGHEDRLLVIEHPDHLSLPGGVVHAGEPVEQALHRTLHDQLGTSIARLDFCAVVEHVIVQSGQWQNSELAFLFDVTLANRGHLAATALRHRWVTDRELSLLQPEAIRTELATGALAIGRPWRAWTP